MILDAENMIFSAGNSFYCMIQQIDMGHLDQYFQTGIIYSIRMILGRDFYFPGFKFFTGWFPPRCPNSQLISPRAIGKPDHLMSKAYSNNGKFPLIFRYSSRTGFTSFGLPGPLEKSAVRGLFFEFLHKKCSMEALMTLQPLAFKLRIIFSFYSAINGRHKIIFLFGGTVSYFFRTDLFYGIFRNLKSCQFFQSLLPARCLRICKLGALQPSEIPDLSYQFSRINAVNTGNMILFHHLVQRGGAARNWEGI